MRLERLPVLLCWLLGLIGAIYSSSAAWVGWLGSHQTSKEELERAVTLAEGLGLRTCSYWLALADLRPEEEVLCLRKALEADERCLAALSRLSLLEEFAGRRDEARRLSDQAVQYHRSFKSYMGALTQAARWGESLRVERLAIGALQYCPRDADGVFAQLRDLELARRVLSKAGVARQVDYLRFLVGQRRLDEAVEYESRLERSPLADRYRLELCELLFWSGQRERAGLLFGSLNPEFRAEGVFNARLMTRPSSMGFDWRISEDRRAKFDWRPGEIAVKLSGREQELELVSILLGPRQPKVARVVPMWTGETQGLHWRVDEAGDRFQRVALVASAGQQQQFQLREVRFE